MKNVIFILFMSFALVSCNKSNKSIQIEVYPQTISLHSKLVTISTPILLSRVMFASGDYLYFYKEKDDTYFDVYKLPECTFTSSIGTKGNGPNDLLFLDPRSFNPVEGGFKAIESGTHIMKTVHFDGNKMFITGTENLFDGKDAINGFYELDDSVYLSFGQISASKEFRFMNAKSGECTEFGIFPDWTNVELKEQYQTFMAYLKNCVVSPDKKRFAVFYTRFKRMRIYDSSGALLRDIDVRVEPNIVNIETDFRDQMSYYMGQPIALGDFIYVLCGNRKEGDLSANNTENELQVWNWNGDIVSCYKLDKRVSAFTISEKYKKIYAFNNLIEDEVYVYDLP